MLERESSGLTSKELSVMHSERDQLETQLPPAEMAVRREERVTKERALAGDITIVL